MPPHFWRRLSPHHDIPHVDVAAALAPRLEQELEKQPMFDYKAVVHSILAGHKIKAAVDLGFNVVHQVELAVSGVQPHVDPQKAAEALSFVQMLFRGYDGEVFVQTGKTTGGYVADIMLTAERMLLPPTLQVKIEDGLVDLAHELLAHGHALPGPATDAAPASQSTSPTPAQQPVSLPTAGPALSTGPTP